MKEIGTITDFADDGRAVVELDGKDARCAGCPSGAFCAQTGEKRQMILDVIPGIARGTQVYVEVGYPTLLKMPSLAYVMTAAFIAGAILGQIVFKAVLRVPQPDVLSILAGLLVAACSILTLHLRESRRNKQSFVPRIIGVVWKGQ